MSNKKTEEQEPDFSNRCILMELEKGITPKREEAARKMLAMHQKCKIKQLAKEKKATL